MPTRKEALTEEDRAFLDQVDAFMAKRRYRGISDEPVNGYQLVISYRRVKGG